ncbi:MAG: hypothetical protein AAGD32_15955 [Planctomycetota bacterium]
MTATLPNPVISPTVVAVRVVVATAVMTALAGVVTLLIGGSWWAGWIAAASVAWIAVIVTAPAMIAVLRQPVTQAMPMFLAVGMGRALVFFVGIFIAIKAMDMPRVPVIVLTMIFYGVVLAVETTAGLRYFKAVQQPAASS